MDYGDTEFGQLIEEIEAQNGIHVDALCTPRKHRIREKPNGKLITRMGTGCSDATLFDVAFDKLTFGKDTESDQLVECGTKDDGSTALMAVPVDEREYRIRVCANDDDLGKWPRFIEALVIKEDN